MTTFLQGLLLRLLQWGLEQLFKWAKQEFEDYRERQIDEATADANAEAYLAAKDRTEKIEKARNLLNGIGGPRV